MLLIDASKKLPKLTKNQDYKIKERNIPGNDGDRSDSDDEPVAYPSVEPPFTEVQLILVQFCFDRLKDAYLSARTIGFTEVFRLVVKNLHVQTGAYARVLVGLLNGKSHIRAQNNFDCMVGQVSDQQPV